MFASFAIVGALVGAAFPASAWSVRQNGSFCMTDPGANVFHSGAGVVNNSAASGRLTCPVIDTSATPKGGVTALSVGVNDGHAGASVTAQACVNFAGAFGGICGASVGSGAAFTGFINLSPPRTRWGAANANDNPYIFVLLPPVSGGSMSHLMGYSFSG